MFLKNTTYQKNKAIFYTHLWSIFDNIFDFLIIIAIWLTAFAGIYELLTFIVWYEMIQGGLKITSVLKISLNAVVIVKVYETLRMFISHEDLSLIHLIEVGLIGLVVKIFFDESYLKREYSIIFFVFFLTYFVLKRWRHKLECENFTIKKTLPDSE
jgi:uncharacterized membrane protein (DUF373 family)